MIEEGFHTEGNEAFPEGPPPAEPACRRRERRPRKSYRRCHGLELRGTEVFPVSREKLWEFLNDPDVLQVAMPGCEKLERVGEDEYKAHLKLGIAAIRGSYEGRISLHDKVEPESYRLVIEASGGPGFVKGEATFTLEDVDENQSRVSFEGEAQVGGFIAGVGQRILDGVAKFIVGQFFKALQAEIKRRAQA